MFRVTWQIFQDKRLTKECILELPEALINEQQVKEFMREMYSAQSDDGSGKHNGWFLETLARQQQIGWACQEYLIKYKRWSADLDGVKHKQFKGSTAHVDRNAYIDFFFAIQSVYPRIPLETLR